MKIKTFEVLNDENIYLNCVQFSSQNVVQLSSYVFQVIKATIVNSSSSLISLRLEALTHLNPSFTAFKYTLENSALYNSSCGSEKNISIGVENASVAVVTTATKHQLKNFEIIELSHIEFISLPESIYRAEVISPYRFILKNISDNFKND